MRASTHGAAAGACGVLSWARLGRWSRATRRRTGRVRPYRAQPWCVKASRPWRSVLSESRGELEPEMAASRSQSKASRDLSSSRVEWLCRGLAPLCWPPQRSCKAAAVASYWTSARAAHGKPACAAVVPKVVVICSATASCVTQAVCSQACQVALASRSAHAAAARARIARMKRRRAARLLLLCCAVTHSPGAARGHRRRLALPRQKS